jgi:signal transduction histidine kinase
LPPLRLNNRQLILYPVAGYGVTLLLVNLGIRTFLGHDWWTRGTRSIFVEDITPHLVAFGVLALNVARQRQKEVSLAQMRLRIASDLHDEIGSDLSSIVMTSQMMNKSASLDMADKQKLSDIGTTALHTASKMRDIVWFINPEHDNVDDLLLKMKDFTLGIMKDMDYEFRTPDTTIPIRLTPDVRRNVLLIYKEIINNIVKHAGAKKVEIEVWIVDSQFILSVSDDGVGFDEQVVKKGEGLQNLRKRASDLGGTLKIQSCPGKGTNITLTAKIT